MAHFAVTMVHGPNWDVSKTGLGGIREQDAFDAHAEFMDRLVEDGFVLVGGPLGDGEAALLIIEAAGESEVMERFAEDPWKPMGMLHVGEIRRLTIWLDAREYSATPDSSFSGPGS
jgi:uncharacterized protein YciI